ncbi:MAG TPA: DUF362 domain-containing protein [Phycisphaerae bacterium]|nr:DUF362 domain-containing protein [Phycisphaerae bacterium]
MPAPLTRREFLARSSTATVGAALGASGWAAARSLADSGAPSQPPTVFRIRADGVVIGRRIHRPMLAQMLEKGLSIATGKPNGIEAWRSILRPDDVVGLKFNRSGADALGTTGALAETMIDSLVAAGFDPSRLVPIEVPQAVYRDTKTARPDLGWQPEEAQFGSGSDRLAAVLDQVTAIINVPFVKTHNIAGLTCCLKNLSHALVKHPARYHENHCSPYVADIVALPPIRTKLRLHLVNALRIVFDGGPEPSEDSIHDAGALFFTTDPVAMDTVALEEINLLRQSRALPTIVQGEGLLSYLTKASEHGLGCAEIHDISQKKAEL